MLQGSSPPTPPGVESVHHVPLGVAIDSAPKAYEVTFRALVEHLPQKVFLKDRQSRYLFVNESYARDLGLTPDVRDDHAAYLGHWLKIIKDDKRAIFSAAAHAQRAADFLQQLQPTTTKEAALSSRDSAAIGNSSLSVFRHAARFPSHPLLSLAVLRCCHPLLSPFAFPSVHLCPLPYAGS